MELEHGNAVQRLFGLDGKTALITGAGGGLGSAIAGGLAAAGAAVMLAGLPGEHSLTRLAEQLARDGARVDTVTADLSDVTAMDRLVAAVTDRFGSLDILVNCAGINRRQPILEVTPEVFDAIISVNLRAVYFLSQAAARAMIRSGGGKIINIGSLTSTVGLQDVSVYGCTKAAIAMLTKTMAVEWAAHNIQVNAIAPGFMRTPLSEPLWQDPDRQRWMVERIPAGRGGQPDELIGTALLLATPASAYLSGQTIYVDGGFLAGSPWPAAAS